MAGEWRPLPAGADWMTGEDQEARLAAVASEDEPNDPDLDLYLDPDHAVPLGTDGSLTAELIAGCREISAEQARAAAHAAKLGAAGALAAIGAGLGRRGPGQPGSACRFPGEYPGPAAGFASGHPLDAAAGCVALAGFADDAAAGDDSYTGVSDDELAGVLCAWDRIEAHAAARKHAAVAELIRRRPARGHALEGPARMPQGWDEFASDELSAVLAESRWAAENMLELAWDLEVKLPGTRAAFRSGVLRESKAGIIARACRILDPAEARAAEALVLGRAGRLTRGGLCSAIVRAVMQVAPEKARKRREQARRDARVERWPEDSGNAALAGRELPPAEVLAADQKISWWAKQLKKAGLTGSMDELRARAFLDILLGKDSRPAGPAGESSPASAAPGKARASGSKARANGKSGTGGKSGAGGQDGPGGGGPGLGVPPEPGGPGAPPGAGPLAGAVPAGFAGRANLTIPVTTLLDLADRPGELGGIGPVDPWLARDLARAAAQHPKTTWCVTVTDQDGHAIGHGCARPEPRNRTARTTARRKPGPPGGHDPPGGTGSTSGPRFSLTPSDQPGPEGGYGTWRLATGTPGQPVLTVALGPVAIDSCDHRHQGAGHDPGAMLRHLAHIRHATCTGPTCRRPAAQADFEHNIPYEAGGRTCLCNGGPKCRHDHRLKQDPRWNVDQPAPGTFRWTTPSGRTYTTGPTRYPI